MTADRGGTCYWLLRPLTTAAMLSSLCALCIDDVHTMQVCEEETLWTECPCFLVNGFF